MSDGSIKDTFITGEFGDYKSDISFNDTEIFKIKFLPGSTDISTQSISETSQSTILTKSLLQKNPNVNVTPITTLVSNIIDNSVGEGSQLTSNLIILQD